MFGGKVGLRFWFRPRHAKNRPTMSTTPNLPILPSFLNSPTISSLASTMSAAQLNFYTISSHLADFTQEVALTPNTAPTTVVGVDQLPIDVTKIK